MHNVHIIVIYIKCLIGYTLNQEDNLIGFCLFLNVYACKFSYGDFVYVWHWLFSNPAVGVGDWLSMSSSLCTCCIHVLYGGFVCNIFFLFVYGPPWKLDVTSQGAILSINSNKWFVKR